jgi:glutamyl-tRNA synthetase
LSKVITRFAPSPTGFLHIGGARTALFNWLYAKHCGGKFLLRIEDTDKKRSTAEATNAIILGMRWLGLEWDEEIYSQASHFERHKEVAKSLLSSGKAYKCYCSKEELMTMREKALRNGSTRLYDGTWRDRDPKDVPIDIKPVIRLKMPLLESTTIDDLIQGKIEVANNTLDDMILLRSDGSPTYMLAAAVDDNDMNISHVLRGDDHLTNTFRQIQIYRAMNWKIPEYAHMPLLHGSDGAKLSKRHGALGVEAYEEMCVLPAAMNNYLLRLGWSHGNDEIITQKQAIEWFEIQKVGKSASRFDQEKLNNINGYYINECDEERLINLVLPKISDLLSDNISPKSSQRLKLGLNDLKYRSKTLLELADNAQVYCINKVIKIEGKALKKFDQGSRELLARVHDRLEKLAKWDNQSLESSIKSIAVENNIGLGKVAQPLRMALSGNFNSPGIFEIMAVLGKLETLKRINDTM